MTTKKMITTIALGTFVFASSSMAMAKSFKGEVTKVSGNSITIELSKKDIQKIAVGDNAKLSVKKAVKPAAGNSALTGC